VIRVAATADEIVEHRASLLVKTDHLAVDVGLVRGQLRRE